MCHQHAPAALPEPASYDHIRDAVEAFHYAQADPLSTLAIIPDIYGCNAFYQSVATALHADGADVYLIDPFAGLGDLPEVTREAAFERRHRLRDKAFLDRFQQSVEQQGIDGVIGFCLGGTFVFELARRGFKGRLVAFYPFPQGLENQDPVPVPFDYLESVTVPHTVLIGSEDVPVGGANVEKLRDVARRNGAIDLHVYRGSSHGFLNDLDHADEKLRGNAQDAWRRCVETVLPRPLAAVQ